MLNKKQARERLSDSDFNKQSNWKSTGGRARSYQNKVTGETISRRSFNEIVRGHKPYEVEARERIPIYQQEMKKHPLKDYNEFKQKYREERAATLQAIANRPRTDGKPQKHVIINPDRIRVKTDDVKKLYKDYKIVSQANEGKTVPPAKLEAAIENLQKAGMIEGPVDREYYSNAEKEKIAAEFHSLKSKH